MNPELTNDRQDMKQKLFEPEDPNNDSAGEDSDNDKPARRSGRRKIKIEYIEDKNRRHITFSKRKAGIMKKAYELSTLTGTQVLLLVVSETGLVYTFTTVKLQPIVTKPEGKNLIQACLNAPDPMSNEQAAGDASYGNSSPQSEDKKLYDDKVMPEPSSAATAAAPSQQPQQPQPPQQQQQNAPNGYNGGNGSNPGYHPSQSPYSQPPPSQPAGNGVAVINLLKANPHQMHTAKFLSLHFTATNNNITCLINNSNSNNSSNNNNTNSSNSSNNNSSRSIRK
ncbi:hypothetical protein G6F42_025099 [Rhizopus arrhizus]|nr:hypothetical protein G6F42_025099 [Rhizopus arrhizus]